MDGLLDNLGALTIEQRVLLGVGVFFAGFAVLVALTALAIRLRRALLLWLGLLAALVVVLLVKPIDTAGLSATPHPARSHADALTLFEADRLRDPVPLNPLCEPRLMTHGARTEKAIVLLHGVSSCPQAFVDLAPKLFERGYNVLVARMPYNGHADRATDALRFLTAEALAEFGDTSVDIAAGLGESVIVLGISAGGTVAAWTAQNRPEVERVVLVAPFFGLADLGSRLGLAAMRAMFLLPDVSVWKDPVLREGHVGMPHAYQRQSTRGIAEIMRLGLATYREAVLAPPAARTAAIITNDADTAVDNAVTARLGAAWADAGMAVGTYAFARDLGLGHELIDPLEPGANPALTTPVILKAIEDSGALAVLRPR